MIAAEATKALEQEDSAADPLEIASSVARSELADWHLVGAVPGLLVFTLGSPFIRLMLCYDRHDQRECVVINADGKEVVRVIGPRVPAGCEGHVVASRFSNNRVDRRIDEVLAALDRVSGSPISSEVR